MRLLAFDQVSLGYNNKNILKNISFNLPSPSITLICGANGAGKSTLAKGILDLIPNSQGKISRFFKNPAYVPQQHQIDSIFPLTLNKLIQSGIKPTLRSIHSTKELKNKIKAILEQVGLSEKGNLLVREASSGQLQRALIARSLIQEPDFIVMDEPFCNLDSQGEKNIEQIIFNLYESQKISLCIIDHPHNSSNQFYSNKLIVENQKVVLQ